MTSTFIERHGLVRWTREIGRHYPRDGSCEICGRSTAELAADAKALGYAPKVWLARLMFDHCHKHLFVRGLLCNVSGPATWRSMTGADTRGGKNGVP